MSHGPSAPDGAAGDPPGAPHLDLEALVCPRCGLAPTGDATFCPQDGRHLVTRAVKTAYPEDAFLGRAFGGRFPLVDVLGQGSMGSVYLSRQLPLGREVAVKLLDPRRYVAQTMSAKQLKARFMREAQLLSSVDHPAIVTLYDFGAEDDGTLFIVMERLQGHLLSDTMRTLPPRALVGMARQLLGALQVAHEKGLVHRDIKPDNIMVLHGAPHDDLSAPRVKLMDFGVAKAVEESGPRLTAYGQAIGTPYYMSPEQAIAAEVDHRTDLYSLGVVLYEALAGRRPFEGKDAMTVMKGVVNKDAPPLPHREDMPADLAKVVERAMKKAPDRRFADARSMARALERIDWKQAQPQPSRDTEESNAPTAVMPALPRDMAAALLSSDSIPAEEGPPTTEHELTTEPEQSAPDVLTSADDRLSEPTLREAERPPTPGPAPAAPVPQREVPTVHVRHLEQEAFGDPRRRIIGVLIAGALVAMAGTGLILALGGPGDEPETTAERSLIASARARIDKRQWKAALEELDAVLEDHPSDPLAVSLQEKAQAEQTHMRIHAEMLDLWRRGEFADALARLARIPRGSVYHGEANARRQTLEEGHANALLDQGVETLRAGDIEGARATLTRMRGLAYAANQSSMLEKAVARAAKKAGLEASPSPKPRAPREGPAQDPPAPPPEGGDPIEDAARAHDLKQWKPSSATKP
ncbi:MAG: serine/threonine-protein kinase [Planctomycetota bacterium]|jgi:serine/threonine-protein kinase